jgi:hypothetical protein
MGVSESEDALLLCPRREGRRSPEIINEAMAV